MAGYVFDTKPQLMTALDEWADNASLAQGTYGSIATWDVTKVKCFKWLMCGDPGWGDCRSSMRHFDADINAWDVSAVTEHKGVRNVQKHHVLPLRLTTYRSPTAAMFRQNLAFNHPLNGWDTTSSSEMSCEYCSAPP